MTRARPLAVGDRVRYTGAWLRSVGLAASDDPRVHATATVVRIESTWVVLQWPDLEPPPTPDLAPGQSRVHPANVGRLREARTYDLPAALTASPAEWRAARRLTSERQS